MFNQRFFIGFIAFIQKIRGGIDFFEFFRLEGPSLAMAALVTRAQKHFREIGIAWSIRRRRVPSMHPRVRSLISAHPPPQSLPLPLIHVPAAHNEHAARCAKQQQSHAGFLLGAPVLLFRKCIQVPVGQCRCCFCWSFV